MVHLRFLPFLVRGLSLALWMMVIFFFSSLSGSEYPVEFTPIFYLERKGAHVIEYAVLMFLSIRFLSLLFPRESLKKILLLAGVFAMTYGASDELHQFFVPYRGAKISDVLIDGLGVFLVGVSVWLVSCTGRRSK